MTDNYIIISCPHCTDSVLIYKQEINCRIFRHAVYKQTGEQVNPHLDQPSCENLSKNEMVYGCCKPFRITDENTHGFFTKSRTKNVTFKLTIWNHNRALNIKRKCYI